MRRTQVDDSSEFYRDSVEFIEYLRESNPKLYKSVEWLLDQPPYLVVLYNAYIPIESWSPMSEANLLSLSGLSYQEFKNLKNENSRIAQDWGMGVSPG